MNAGRQVCGRTGSVAGTVPAGLCRTPVAGTGLFASIDATSTMHRKRAQSAATRDGMVALVFLSCGTGDYLHEWLTLFMIKGEAAYGRPSPVLPGTTRFFPKSGTGIKNPGPNR